MAVDLEVQRSSTLEETKCSIVRTPNGLKVGVHPNSLLEEDAWR
jgi:hypothetical protein